ncbi:beta-galactosidase [Yeosuana aromativorans]|uniref:Beta-galactosidase n=1 Tax=Yeosuana aromativorans TaxID=288019 RepID=A0A8J3FDK0_9FLAO|nr:glycoside hydrolase family 2 TIM barrel-domain containing protein [Yeosuana aromativorans]GGK10328.1 beta-galactosidase [Yeosuana aromativorans]
MTIKAYKLAFLLLFALFSNLTSNAQVRETINLQNDWKFIKGNPENASQITFDDTQWKTVKIPHDWAIGEPFIKDGDGNTGKLPWKAEGWYRKILDIKPSYKNKRVILVFDGVMAFPKVYINGNLAGEWDYGYNSFYIDITNFLNFDKKNILAVHADTHQHDSRWYPGGGIYRKVQMIVTNPVHVNIWGTYITTPIIKENLADVRISSIILNQSKSDQEVKIEHIIVNSNGNEIDRDSISRTVLSGKDKNLEVTLQVPNPEMWDIKNPVLYSVKTNVFIDNKLSDSEITKFGIRNIKFTADDGFHLNGRRVQLKGVNLHSDLGPLGMAFNKRALQRELEIMKSMGVNAVRNSHNVAAPELLDLCDEMGLLLFDEAFDKYDAKIDITDDTNFEDFAHRNIKNFVVRDRNHPCVFIWSVGNEIGDVQNNINNGFQRLHTMVNYVDKYDPTRPVTLVNDNMQSAALRHFDYYDVHSWNYGRRYRLARELEPNKSVIISESASTVSTRGFYEFPLPDKKTDFTKSLQVSSYDLNAPAWAEISDDDFMWQQDEPYVAGEFVWTGFDYLGEPTPYSNQEVKKMGMTDKDASRSSYFGIVDLVGIPKDRYYLYKSYWKPEETTVHILPHWNWEGKEGDTIPVFVYTNGNSAELFVNGKSQGKQYKKPDSKNSVERFRLMWKDVVYQPGEVKAVAYKNGVEIETNVVKTAGKPYQLKLTADRTELDANGKDLSYILIEAVDKQGNLCPLADNNINISIKGDAHIAGVGNGNPQSFAPFQSNTIKLFYGKAMVIVGSNNNQSDLLVKATSKGLKSHAIKLEIK